MTRTNTKDLSVLQIIRACVIKAKIEQVSWEWWINQIMQPGYDDFHQRRDTRRFVTLWWTRLNDPEHLARYKANAERIAAERKLRAQAAAQHRATKAARQARRKQKKGTTP